MNSGCGYRPGRSSSRSPQTLKTAHHARSTAMKGCKYSNAGYDLPPLKVHYHKVLVDHGGAGADRDGQTKIFRDAAMGLKDASREKRDSLEARIAKMTEIIELSPDDNFLIWHDLEAERHAIKKALPEVVDIYGSQDLETRERRGIDFSHGRIKYFAPKTD